MTGTTRRRLARATAAGIVAAGVLALPALAAAAEDFPGDTRPAELTVAPGASFTLSGTACQFPGAAAYVRIVIQVPPAGQILNEVVRAGEDGTWSITATLFADTAPGTYNAYPICGDPQDQTFQTWFALDPAVLHVGDAPPGTTPPGEPTTTGAPGPPPPTFHVPAPGGRPKPPPRRGGAPKPGAVRATPRYTG
jgi:hypothetical protein